MNEQLYKTAKRDLVLYLDPKELRGISRYDLLGVVDKMQEEGYMYILDSSTKTHKLSITFKKISEDEDEQ